MKLRRLTTISNKTWDILKLSVGGKTRREDIKKIYSKPSSKIYGFVRNRKLAAVAGVKILKGRLIITHIAVSVSMQNQGIGTELLKQIQSIHAGYRMLAETDKYAINFYRKNGFTSKKYNSKWGVVRYKVERKEALPAPARHVV